MTLYGIKEATFFALVGVSLVMLLPRHFLLLAWSPKAFQAAYRRGLVRTFPEPAGVRQAFFIAAGCPHRWLVKRYIKARW